VSHSDSQTRNTKTNIIKIAFVFFTFSSYKSLKITTLKICSLDKGSEKVKKSDNNGWQTLYVGCPVGNAFSDIIYMMKTYYWPPWPWLRITSGTHSAKLSSKTHIVASALTHERKRLDFLSKISEVDYIGMKTTLLKGWSKHGYDEGKNNLVMTWLVAAAVPVVAWLEGAADLAVVWPEAAAALMFAWLEGAADLKIAWRGATEALAMAWLVAAADLAVAWPKVAAVPKMMRPEAAADWMMAWPEAAAALLMAWLAAADLAVAWPEASSDLMMAWLEGAADWAVAWPVDLAKRLSVKWSPKKP
jgi:hypothetical protein